MTTIFLDTWYYYAPIPRAQKLAQRLQKAKIKPNTLLVLETQLRGITKWIRVTFETLWADHELRRIVAEQVKKNRTYNPYTATPYGEEKAALLEHIITALRRTDPSKSPTPDQVPEKPRIKLSKEASKKIWRELKHTRATPSPTLLSTLKPHNVKQYLILRTAK